LVSLPHAPCGVAESDESEQKVQDEQAEEDEEGGAQSAEHD
jgi:hypothetical protein